MAGGDQLKRPSGLGKAMNTLVDPEDVTRRLLSQDKLASQNAVQEFKPTLQLVAVTHERERQ